VPTAMSRRAMRIVITAGASLLAGVPFAAIALVTLVDAGFSTASVAVLMYVAWVVPAVIAAGLGTLAWRAYDRRSPRAQPSGSRPS
jgi:hypothetical protein